MLQQMAIAIMYTLIMIAFTCFLIVTLLSYMNCCTFNKVPRSIVDDMYLVNVIKLMLFLHITLYINQI